MNLKLVVIPGLYAVCRLAPESAIPTWALQGGFFSVSGTADELSVVCVQDQVPAGVQCEQGWSLIKVQGPMDFGLTGILAALAGPLAQAAISIFAVSTFETDYLLVKAENLEKARTILVAAGHDLS
ncbi:MAG: ACT domain-containing protein [Deltaproteobacteria bacterium]|nr:ACT domain-containing protein [Deltaproteobacteria bacterium]